jgi:hypothetical protein
VYTHRKDVDVTEIRVKELDVENKPTSDACAILLDVGTNIERESNRNEPPDVFRLKQQERITPEDLPRLEDMLSRRRQEPLMDTAVHAHKTLSWWHWALIGGNVILILANGFAFYRRRRAALV